jgi:hypothetical protein
MRCENANGSGNCNVNWIHEPSSGDDTTWPNLNGGSDGLKMQNIQVRNAANTWGLVTSSFTGGQAFWKDTGIAPYIIREVANYYNFRSFRSGEAASC